MSAGTQLAPFLVDFFAIAEPPDKKPIAVIIKAHDGDIRVASKRVSGTIVPVDLPFGKPSSPA